MQIESLFTLMWVRVQGLNPASRASFPKPGGPQKLTVPLCSLAAFWGSCSTEVLAVVWALEKCVVSCSVRVNGYGCYVRNIPL